MCHHTQELTVLSRMSCRPSHLNVDRFHQPCLLPWRNPLLPPKHGWLLGRDRWCLSVPRTTWRPLTLFGQPGSSSFASHWSFSATSTRRYHGRTLIRDMPWGPHLPDHLPDDLVHASDLSISENLFLHRWFFL